MISYKQKLKDIEAFIFDVDGVITNGMALLHPDGEYLREVYARDMQAFRLAKQNGFHLCAITAGRSETVKKALFHLGFDMVYLGKHDKLDSYNDYLKLKNIHHNQVLYMGDDIADIPVLENVGVSSCPYDAVQEVRKRVDYVSHLPGGRGAVRDVIEQTLRVKGLWNY